MAEEKKPKIDLKARLAKAQGGVAPAQAPVVPASVPSPGSVPPPGPLPGVQIPTPPFTTSARPSAAVEALASLSQPPPRSIAPVAPATIKIELDDEVVRAQARGGKRAAMIGILAAVVGMGIGFVFGSRSTDASIARNAVQGAKELVKDVESSQVKVKQLSERIGAAIKDLKDKKFPETFAGDLGGLSIPFGPDKLYGRGVGRFNERTLKLLFSYTQDVEALNDRKDALRNLFSGQKKAIVDTLASAGNPKVTWSVFLQRSPAHGPVAILAPIVPADVFAYRDNWPAKFKVAAGRDQVETVRYDKGDPISTDKTVSTFPLDPDSVASGFPNDVVARITSELLKTDGVLNGQPGDEDSVGLFKKGEQLLTELRKIGN